MPSRAVSAITAVAATAAAVGADNSTTPICSCTPRSYSFRINFDGDCDAETLDDDPGIDGSICFYTEGRNPNDLNVTGFGASRRGGSLRRTNSNDAVSGKWQQLLDKVVPFPSHYKHASDSQRRRRTQDTTPTVVTSVTFLEADSSSSLNIINQNSTYYETNLTDGDVISYPSISSHLNASLPLTDQMDVLPGGVMLVLFGLNSNNNFVQNTIAWGYKLDECTGVPLQVDDAIGWISLDDYTPPLNAFCPAVTDPTTTPTAIPTVSPSEDEYMVTSFNLVTPQPTAAPVVTQVSTQSPTKGKSAKKSSKSSKNGKSAEMSYQLFAKSSKPKAAKLFKQELSLHYKAKATKLFKEEMSHDYLFPKSVKGTAKAAKLFKPKAEKGLSYDAGFLDVKGSSSKSAKVGSVQVYRPEDPKGKGHVQVSRPKLPTPQMSYAPVTSPVSSWTTLSPVVAVDASTPFPTASGPEAVATPFPTESAETESSDTKSPVEETITRPPVQVEEAITRPPVQAVITRPPVTATITRPPVQRISDAENEDI